MHWTDLRCNDGQTQTNTETVEKIRTGCRSGVLEQDKGTGIEYRYRHSIIERREKEKHVERHPRPRLVQNADEGKTSHDSNRKSIVMVKKKKKKRQQQML